MTTRLFEEMVNLRLKQNGTDLTVEKINSNKPKDKYSALIYGLWRIKELEEQQAKKRGRRGGRKMIYYT
jgi:hypothetical protein